MIITKDQYLKYKKENNQEWYRGRKFFQEPDRKDKWIITNINYNIDRIFYFIERLEYKGDCNVFPFYESVLNECSDCEKSTMEKMSVFINNIKNNI